MTLGILCGLEVEAALARRVRDAHVACAAARPQQARLAARGLIAQGATRLLSFGLAGGLDTSLPAGTILIGAAVATEAALWSCDENWGADLLRRLPMAQSGALWGSETIVASARDKQALYAKTRCLAADMESQAVAEVAAASRVPFAALRVIADTATMNVPPAALVPLRSDGRVDLGHVLLNLLRQPCQLPELIRLGLNTQLAKRQLSLAATAL